MKILAADLSFAKTGVAVISVKDRKPTIDYAALIVSNKNKSSIDRIDDTVTEIKLVASKVGVDTVLKEASIIRQVSSATPVIKTHAVFEHELGNKYKIEDISNSTVKAWARTVTQSDGKRKDKEMVAEAVEKYYGRRIDEIWTARGKLIDDVADAIAIATLWLEREGHTPTKYERSK